MRKRCLIVTFLLACVPAVWAGEVLDQVVAIVNGHVVLQSDWDDEIRYECFMSDQPIGDISPDQRREALDRLIDQELLREQIRTGDFKAAGSDETAKQMEELKAGYAQDHNGQSWDSALSKYDVDENDVRAHVELELNQFRLVDARLRPSIQVDTQTIETYYKEQLVPKLGGGASMTLQEASPKIRELLLQQKMNELLNSWLESLRSQARIRIVVSVTPESRAQAQ